MLVFYEVMAAVLAPIPALHPAQQHLPVQMTSLIWEEGGGSADQPLGGLSVNKLSVNKDPLQKPRPQYDLAAPSGRPNEPIFGARAPESASEMAEWVAHMKERGIRRVVALLDVGEAALRSPDGSATGYIDALAASFNEAIRIDVQEAGASSTCYAACLAAKNANEPLCFHCADGNAHTSLMLSQWLLKDYIGGENCQEATDSLVARKRHSGVEWSPDPLALEYLLERDTLAGYVYVEPADDDVIDLSSIEVGMAADGLPGMPEEEGGPKMHPSGLFY
mmetsp:Transcript_56749/g.93886  ORF Transcript_56749/g.93886 Transcript_56749/m.93886 type:complete len:278 (-) Transcript_56749:121-954(-)